MKIFFKLRTCWETIDKKIIWAVSALLFLLLFAWLRGWIFASTIYAIVALHEGGHWLAMKLTGYRDLEFFFIPGQNGATTEEKLNATLFEKMAVLLAGPVPGLILAVGTWIIMGEFFPTAFMKMPFELYVGLQQLFFINYLNLLPISPLDGGRVVDLLFFSRFPKLLFYFAAFCCVILFAVGMVQRGSGLIPVAIVVFVEALPPQWALMRGRLLLKEHLGAFLSEEAANKQVFEALQDPCFKWSSPKPRMQIQKTLVSECMGRQLSSKEFGVGVVVYVLCLSVSAGLAYVDGLQGLLRHFFLVAP
ncbi:MAG: hypothetical protein LBP21_10055 [Synergistaceae bacterium]|nr:hypothetical protein [Synergistaceae bacterium]